MDDPFKWSRNVVSSVPDAVNTNRFTNLAGLATIFANIAIIIGFGLAIIAIAYSFVMFVTGGGDPKTVQKAKRALTWSIIGLLVSAGAWGIKYIFFNLLGIGDLS
ncbi:MAG: hypothetical protein UU64_C0004G0053 [candidate division WWE3 bacterium GW2011_GWF2_41_45]|uniref:Uncharacterized protein n=3 Tax=Katanobacteria TaxID=422282 RepID=A0A1F4W178_UNCKA|nr:MAG: hypothetical protein UU55_C0007G0039 [candidate division WWE3 bacterium GW2011_GWC2_41_23]KKS10456.1 MAG: hypothetical protein UU64_C0004G0053 [candidate division WWE3 bacterium GW2011_GWF2_41_45]KKS19760.1 MAG: hypothetical protein UU79_C0010G0005 [candidate division WWE3 bacterium GW2011_GWE1_41_72]KKS26318.1 MAG: hypothetical protein UU86_C0041G0006 [candidate division WWE3 bacterium GW2011_GWC1_42_102]KKS29942.1 MAG: hypothetical protein UU90_C0006G0007 [candidate division WWE3 bact